MVKEWKPKLTEGQRGLIFFVIDETTEVFKLSDPEFGDEYEKLRLKLDKLKTDLNKL